MSEDIPDHRIANAHLIASAPDMYAVLELAGNALASFLGSYTEMEPYLIINETGGESTVRSAFCEERHECAVALERISDALAKARGGVTNG